MDHSDDKFTRRARQKPIQSCEIVGILPAEELALRKALYASLVQESPGKSKSSDTDSGPVKKIKLELDTKESDIEVICLSSPDLSEDDSRGSKAVERTSLLVSSCPSSPQSCRSTNSMHLCLSSSSSSWYSTSESSSSSSSCESFFSPWSQKKLTRKPAPKRKGKQAPAKRLLNFEGKCEVGRVGVKLKSGKEKLDVVRGKPRVKQQTARKSASKPKTDVCKDEGLKDVPFQAQRKFAVNPPPIRFPLGKVKHVTGLKAPPKTEDFITYLCLRGSSNIPKHLRRFQTPWTPLKKEPRTAKIKK